MTALGLLAVAVLFPQLSGALRAGMDFLFRKEAMARMIAESKPLFSMQAGLSSYRPADLLLSWALYLVPVVLVWMFLARQPGERRFTPPRTFFLIATLYFGALTLFQQRFTYIFAMNVSIAWAYLIVGIARKAGPVQQALPQLAGGVAAACALLLLAEPIERYFSASQRRPDTMPCHPVPIAACNGCGTTRRRLHFMMILNIVPNTPCSASGTRGTRSSTSLTGPSS